MGRTPDASPRLLGDVVDEPHAAATLSALSTDSKLQRQNALRQAARVAFLQVQTDQALQRSLLHRSRVKKTHYECGDLVYVYRERKPTKGKKAIKMWLGPCTVIGAEGQNLWVSRGRRCLLCAPEHMRPAEPEELGELLKVKASLDNIQELLDGKGVQDWAFEAAEADEQPDQEEAIQMDNMDWDSVVLERRRKLLDDVPWQFKKARVEHSVLFGKVARTEDTREKQLDAELPWTAIDPKDRPEFLKAEQKQWQEHIQTIPPERILRSRFAYKDKNRPLRRQDGSVPVKAKARLCVGGHRDPDLGQERLAVDAPTATKTSTMAGAQLAASQGWVGSIGDVQSAFLNGVAAPRGLYFEQPVRGLPGETPGCVVEILKGVFGLSTSPRLWFEKLANDLRTVKLHQEGDTVTVEESPIDPCAFVLVRNGNETCGVLEAHVDDLILWTEEKLKGPMEAAPSALFPISDWERDVFTYVGNEYVKTTDGYLIKQQGYAENRLKEVDVPKGANADEIASADLMQDNRTAVGCLSWLAKETRPDLACQANMAQVKQKSPTIGDVKATNAAVRQAKEFAQMGVEVKAIPLSKMAMLVFHDAAWGNAEPQDPDLEWEEGHRVASQIGYLVCAIDQRCLGQSPGPLSVLCWKSHACKRVCRSTFAGETMAACEAMEAAIHFRAQLLGLWRRRLVSEPEAAKELPIHAVTDCKSLFDYVHRCGAPKATADKRLVIDLASLRQIFLNEAKGLWWRCRGDTEPTVDDPLAVPFHWVPSELQLSDILTKQMRCHMWWESIRRSFFLAVRT
ncbi:GIP [Symbiodinium sp. KB8]|nr:GIP [Symbiodinium sp. KB8]